MNEIKRVQVYLLIVALLSIIYTTIFYFTNVQVQQTGSTIFFLLAPLIVFTLQILLIIKANSLKKFLFFFFSMSTAVYLVAEFYQSLSGHLWGINHFQNVVVLLYASYTILIGLSFMTISLTGKDKFQMIDLHLDLIMYFIMSLLLIWLFILEPLYAHFNLGTMENVYPFLNPSVDLIMIFSMIMSLSLKSKLYSVQTISIFLLSFVLFLMADLSILYHESFLPAYFARFIRSTALLLQGIAAVAIYLDKDSLEELQTKFVYKGRSFSLLRSIMQVVCMMIISWLYIKQSSILTGCVLFIIILIVFTRQFLANIQIQSLANSLKFLAGNLEKEVEDQIIEIKNKNKALEIKSNELKHLAMHDNLTGLYNRRGLEEKISNFSSNHLNETSRYAVLFIDIDKFKHVNDSLGHSYGDELLIQFTTRLKKSSPEKYFIVRHSGDEFIILLEEIVDQSEVNHYIEKLISEMKGNFFIFEHALKITFSLGVALSTDQKEDIQELLRRADLAMYSAKRKGRNHFQFYSNGLEKTFSRRVELISELETALKEEKLEVYYQPQVSIQSGEVEGVEALIRWDHPQLGVIQPDQFIPLVEDFGMVGQVDEYVMEKACHQISQWSTQYQKSICVSVNVSPTQFYQHNFAQKIQSVLDRSGLRSTELSIELTERVMMYKEEIVLNRMAQLNNIGVSMCIDDFGTGYSSISYLKDFHFQKLKLDRSFITELRKGDKSEAIVKSMIDLSHRLDMEVIAEGVETEEQFQHLKELGCDFIQGYLFSKPLSEVNFESLLKGEINI